jgi:O-antigen/teichoic acid export membrane protein
MTDGGTAGVTTQESVQQKLSARLIFRNFSFLIVGKTLGDVFTFILFVLLSRAFGQEGIGQYSFAMALAGFFWVFAEFGLYNLSIKEMSRHTGDLGEYYGGIFSLRLILSIIVLSVLLLALPFLPFPHDTKLIIGLVGAYQIISALIDGFAAVCIAREDMHLAGSLDFAFKAITALVGIIIIMAGGDLVMVMIAFPIVAVVLLFVIFRVVTKNYGHIKLSFSWSYLTRKLREAIPFGLSELLVQLSSRVDVVLMGFFLSATAVGVYNAAYRVVFILMFVPVFAALSLFPMMSRLYVNSQKDLATLYTKLINLIILIGLPTSAGLWLIAPKLIYLIFGEDFAESALMLRYFAWLLLLAFLKSFMKMLLTSCDRQAEGTRSQWTAACVNAVGNVILIPSIGIKGAAIAVLASETLLVILYAMQIRTFIGRPRVGSRLVMSTVGTAIFCATFSLLPAMTITIVIPASIAIYAITLLCFKGIRENEIPMLMDLLALRKP